VAACQTLFRNSKTAVASRDAQIVFLEGRQPVRRVLATGLAVFLFSVLQRDCVVVHLVRLRHRLELAMFRTIGENDACSFRQGVCTKFCSSHVDDSRKRDEIFPCLSAAKGVVTVSQCRKGRDQCNRFLHHQCCNMVTWHVDHIAE
jgi:hypothetical protein